MNVLLNASVSQPFYTGILISHFGRKICKTLNNGDWVEQSWRQDMSLSLRKFVDGKYA